MAVEPYGICRDALVAKYYQALDNIVQLTDIACPRHIAKHRNSLVVNVLGGKGVARTYLLDKVVYEQPDIATPLTQGRHINLNHAQTMV